MNPIQWAQFSWDLTKATPSRPSLPSAFAIRRATRDDEITVRTVVMSGFKLQSDWNAFFYVVQPMVEAALERLFDDKAEPLCLVMAHGPRIIGASGLSVEKEACNHLLTGPCIAMEYHNRGLASALLAHSLNFLREAGLSTVRGVTKEGSATAQFIYPKFGSARVEPPETLCAELGKRARASAQGSK